jgi:NADPH-dependent 2,4-dienoyl-CoA reductase/sulfur reductase-like enzyme
MDIDFLPTHLVILGGSYVGLEFAQMYRRFGSEVTVIELGPRLISREDADVSQAVADFLNDEGIDVRVDSKVIGAEEQGNSIAVKVESGGKITNIVGTQVLVVLPNVRPIFDLDGFGYGLLAVKPLIYLATPAGFEPATFSLEGCCSIP